MSELNAVADLAAVEYDPFADAPLARVVPTTEPQREVWLASQLSSEASLAYNESISLRLRGPLVLEALRASVQDLVARHEALRSTLSADGQELGVADSLSLDIPVIELGGASPAERDAALARSVRDAVESVFDLEHGPLVRARVLHLGEDDHLLVFTAHHIVCDGWSFGVIVNDIARLYLARIGRSVEKGPDADSFADYAIAQNAWAATEEHAADEAYWLGRFSGTVPVLDLPTDRPRKAMRTFASRRADVLVDADLVGQVRRLGARQGSSLFSALLAGFAASLARIAGVDDIVIGVPSAGQSVAGHHHLVGHCVNLLPLRLAYDPRQPLTTAMSAAQSVMLDAFEHPQYTFGTLLKKLSLARDPSRLPLVSVMFNLDQALDADAVGFPDLKADFWGNPRSYENFELFVNAVQLKGGLRLECQYNSDLFDDATVRRWLGCYETMLRDACARPEVVQGELAFAGPADLALLSRWNDTRSEFRRDARVHTLFEEQARRTPDRIAVRLRGDTRSYAELDRRANQIAHRLRSLGVQRGSLVGLNVDRNPEMLAAMLGVLKAGAAYVPLDPAYPKDRLAYMAGDAGLAALVTQRVHVDVLSWPREHTLLLDADAAELQRHPATPLPADDLAAQGEDAAYVIYTSGSTGKPKGVQVPHRSVVNYLGAMAKEPGLTVDDRLLAVTTLSFDIAVTELLLPLTVGAEILLASRDDALDGEQLLRMITEQRATVMQATPATWRLLLETGWSGTPGFRALCGGEALPVDLAQQLLGRVESLWNMYGPTETTVWSTCCRVESTDTGITIGRPIANTSVWILDERLQTCPIGVPGEIFIGGDGVTLGYLHRPELTAERFIADPFNWSADAHLYRTGDRGRWRGDGTIEHLGRNDFQVKVRGFRIELGEIETALLGDTNVARAVVVTREDRPGDVRLIAYLVAHAGATLSDAALSEHLRSSLPDYMIPQHFVTLAAIPLLPNGKVDRHALPPPQTTGSTSSDRADFMAPQSDLEVQVVDVMQSVLSLGGLGMRDDFFRLGGHSLLAARLIARINRELQVSLPMRTAFECPTAQQLVRAVEQARGAGKTKVHVPIVHQADQTRGPLTLSQARIRFVEEMHPGRVAYNTPSAHRLRGPLDAAAFDRAFQEVVARQSALRTVIVASGTTHEQRVLDHVEFSLLPVEDLSGVPSAEREAELMRRLDTLIDKPFDLARGPLFAARLFKLEEDHHALFFMTHHMVWDGWSFDLLYEEMASAYGAALAGRPNPMPAPAISFIDYAHWHNQWLASDECRAQVDYWKAQFAGAEPPRDIQTDLPRKPGMSGRGATEWVHIDRALTDRLHAVGRQADATLNMIALAAYAAMLHVTAQSRDLTLGIPVRGRSMHEFEPVMGFFNNLLPLRVRVDPSLPFVDWVRDVKRLMLGGFDHQDVPFERLVQEVEALRDSRSAGAYQALFSFQDARERTRTWGGLKQEGILVFQRGATEDLGLWLMEGPGGLEGGVTYNADLFLPQTAALLRARFVRLLERIAAQPNATLERLLDVGDDELRALTPDDVAPESRDLLAALAEARTQRGNELAAQAGDRRWTWSVLGDRVDSLAAALDAGAGPARRIAVRVSDPLTRLAAWLAVWRGGRCCVMSASAESATDLSGADAILGDTAARERAPASMPFVDVVSASAPPPGAEATVHRSGTALEIRGDVVATGLSYAQVAQLTQSMANRIAVPEGAAWVVCDALPDPTGAIESLAALTAGCSVLFVSSELARDGDQLAVVLAAAQPGIAHLPPSSWRALLDAWWTAKSPLAALVDGVETHLELAQALSQAGCQVWTMHRPAALSLPMTLASVPSDADAMHMGVALLPGALQVVSDEGKALPVGVFGRLVARFDGVAVPAGSGELARWRADGRLVVRDDASRRVWLHGQHIDLARLEELVTSLGRVSECIVTVSEKRPGDRRLEIYVVPADAGTVDETRIHAAIASALPRAVRIDALSVLSSVPRLPDGRPDRGALLARVAGGAADRPVPSTPTELALAQVWSELLGIPQVELADNFFDLGGSSLLAMQAVEQVAERTGKRISPRRYVFESLAQLALAYDAEDVVAAEPPSVAPIPKAGLLGKLGSLFKRGG